MPGAGPILASFLWLTVSTVPVLADEHPPPDPTRIERNQALLFTLEWGGLGLSSLGVVIAAFGESDAATVTGFTIALSGMTMGMASLALRPTYDPIRTYDDWRLRRWSAIYLVGFGSALAGTGLGLLLATAGGAPRFADDDKDGHVSTGRLAGLLGGSACFIAGTAMIAAGARFANHLGPRPERELAVEIGLGRLGFRMRF